jgi:excisionase family DNA binding protein
MTTERQILQIEGLTAQNVLELFNNVNKRLDDLGAKVAPPDTVVFLTREEVAELLRISIPTVWAWSKQGILTRHHLGNKVRYLKSEVIAAAKATGKGGGKP